MRIGIVLFCLLVIFSCKTEKKVSQKPHFLIGNWIRVNDKIGKTTYETWNTDYTGQGVTVKGKDTVFKEILSIVTLKDTLFLKVEGVNKNATLFKFTKQTDTSFVCENQKNEFPKKIKYWIENRQLKAEVSANDFKIDFVFTKKK